MTVHWICEDLGHSLLYVYFLLLNMCISVLYCHNDGGTSMMGGVAGLL